MLLVLLATSGEFFAWWEWYVGEASFDFGEGKTNYTSGDVCYSLAVDEDDYHPLFPIGIASAKCIGGKFI